jgi:hypothetical protein
LPTNSRSDRVAGRGEQSHRLALGGLDCRQGEIHGPAADFPVHAPFLQGPEREAETRSFADSVQEAKVEGNFGRFADARGAEQADIVWRPYSEQEASTGRLRRRHRGQDQQRYDDGDAAPQLHDSPVVCSITIGS